MPRRKPSASSSRSSSRIIKRLRDFDIECSCKCSLIVSCAIGSEPGCRQRRRSGICDCKPRELPTCILHADTPHGCAAWREGKSCACPRQPIPRCLVTGCDERQRGRKCECPRTPTELCQHVRAKLQQFAGLMPQQADAMADAWAEQLWTIEPGKKLDDGYADRPLAATGCTVRTRKATEFLMTIRHAMGLSLWHPEDRRGLTEENARMRRQATGLRRLFGIDGSEKAGAA